MVTMIIASSESNSLTNRVANLCLVLDDMKNNLSGHQITEKQAEDLSRLTKGCRSVLDDTEKLIRKNESLGAESSGLGTKTHKAWKKLNWDSATVTELRDRMVSNATYLNTFNISLARSVSPSKKSSIPKISNITDMKCRVVAHFYSVECPE